MTPIKTAILSLIDRFWRNKPTKSVSSGLPDWASDDLKIVSWRDGRTMKGNSHIWFSLALFCLFSFFSGSLEPLVYSSIRSRRMCWWFGSYTSYISLTSSILGFHVILRSSPRSISWASVDFGLSSPHQIVISSWSGLGIRASPDPALGRSFLGKQTSWPLLLARQEHLLLLLLLLLQFQLQLLLADVPTTRNHPRQTRRTATATTGITGVTATATTPPPTNPPPLSCRHHHQWLWNLEKIHPTKPLNQSGRHGTPLRSICSTSPTKWLRLRSGRRLIGRETFLRLICMRMMLGDGMGRGGFGLGLSFRYFW